MYCYATKMFEEEKPSKNKLNFKLFVCLNAILQSNFLPILKNNWNRFSIQILQEVKNSNSICICFHSTSFYISIGDKSFQIKIKNFTENVLENTIEMIRRILIEYVVVYATIRQIL